MRLRLGEKEYTGTDRSIKLAQRAAAQSAFDDQQSTIITAMKEQKESQKNSNNYCCTDYELNFMFILFQ